MGGAMYEVIGVNGGINCRGVVEGDVPGALGDGEMWWGVGSDVAGVGSHVSRPGVSVIENAVN